MKLTKKQLEKKLKRAETLLLESIRCLDRDYCWEESEAYEKKVKAFFGVENLPFTCYLGPAILKLKTTVDK
jgi:hypothetical protein